MDETILQGFYGPGLPFSGPTGQLRKLLIMKKREQGECCLWRGKMDTEEITGRIGASNWCSFPTENVELEANLHPYLKQLRRDKKRKNLVRTLHQWNGSFTCRGNLGGVYPRCMS